MACSVLSNPLLLRRHFESTEHNMGKYFLQNHELPEPDAAIRWFAYAESHGIDIPKAISIWEDAATEDGAEARQLISAAGITVETH
ncbi:hypothetical protein BH160DRAFT_0854 [Burkholderia sp. H160]|nr:hypothetical protein BH160DRAFT_0854 [Burkholderia sp. H160]